MVECGAEVDVLLLLFACRPATPDHRPDRTPTDETTSSPTDPLPDPCAPAADLAFTQVTSGQPWHENELRVHVELSAESSVAVACTLRADPDEVHLAEDPLVGTAHDLRLSGLLADSDYDCVAAAVCPATPAPSSFSVHTGPEHDGAVTLQTTRSARAGDEYVLLAQYDACDWAYQWLDVFDRDGRLRWWYPTPADVGPSIEFRYHGAGRFEWGGGWSPNPLGRPRQIDLFDGEVYDSTVGFGESNYHHDGKQLPDGRLLSLEQVPVEGQVGSFDGFRVRRLDPSTGQVDFEYHSQRAFDEGHLEGGSGDAWHANWVDVVNDTLVVSLCFAQQIVAVDVATGDWKWTFAPGGDWKLQDASGQRLPDSEFPQCQHGIEYSADDHLLVYDNGYQRGYTRAVEYALDPSTRTATELWQWTEPGWSEGSLGDVDYLPSGHILVDEAHAECSDHPYDRTTVVELDPATGEKLWQGQFREGYYASYRADWADPCALFADAAVCPAVADRLAALAPVLSP